MMTELTIYHNGECSKSRGALELLQDQGIPHQIRWYLADPLTAGELRQLLGKLGLMAAEVIRRSEPLYLACYEGKELSEEEWIGVLAAHPELLERPIVELGDRAIIARPPEKLLAFL